MQKIIIVAATEVEIAPFQTYAASNKDARFAFCITGVGMVATTYRLTKAILDIQSTGSTIRGILNIGIAGSFLKSIPIGEVVQISEDCFSELGAQNDHTFISIEDLGFGKSLYKSQPFLHKHPEQSFPKEYQAITTNTVHGRESSIQEVTARLQPQIESMEGAATFFVAEQFGLPVQQFRAISNYVEKRDQNTWNIPLAISNVNNWLHEYFYKQDSL